MTFDDYYPTSLAFLLLFLPCQKKLKFATLGLRPPSTRSAADSHYLTLAKRAGIAPGAEGRKELKTKENKYAMSSSAC